MADSVRNRRLVVYESLMGAGPVDDKPRRLLEDEDDSGFQGGGGDGGLFGLPTWITGGVSSPKRRGNPLYDKLTGIMDLTMLAMLGDAKERTEGGFRALFARAGFRLVKIVPTKTPLALMLFELWTIPEIE